VRRDLKIGEGQTYLPEMFSAALIGFHAPWHSLRLNVANDLAEALKTNPG